MKGQAMLLDVFEKKNKNKTIKSLSPSKKKGTPTLSHETDARLRKKKKKRHPFTRN
jgi:hypothetical protein